MCNFLLLCYSVSKEVLCLKQLLCLKTVLLLLCYSVSNSYSVSKAVQRYVFSATFQSKKTKNCTKVRKTCAFWPFCAMFCVQSSREAGCAECCAFCGSARAQISPIYFPQNFFFDIRLHFFILALISLIYKQLVYEVSIHSYTQLFIFWPKRCCLKTEETLKWPLN